MAFSLTEELQFLYSLFRHCIGVLSWIWAIFVFVLGYYGGEPGLFDDLDDDTIAAENNNEPERPSLFRTMFVPILKVLVSL